MRKRYAQTSDGDKCRRNKWTAGTLLRGTETYEGIAYATTIQITAVGIDMILARQVIECGYARETLWTLVCRRWRKVGFTKVAR
jgi:hypothetical protein